MKRIVAANTHVKKHTSRVDCHGGPSVDNKEQSSGICIRRCHEGLPSTTLMPMLRECGEKNVIREQAVRCMLTLVCST